MPDEPFICEKCGKGPEDHFAYLTQVSETVICGKPPEDMPWFQVQSNAGFDFHAAE